MDNTIQVYNRKLEQVLFYLGQKWIACDKTEQGMTVWTYNKTEDVVRIIKLFNESIREHKKGA